MPCFGCSLALVAWLLGIASAFAPASLPRPLVALPSTRLAQDWRAQLPSNQVIDAVSDQNKVIASDVAATAGVSLAQARRELTSLASLTQGDIQVDQSGELIYLFPKDVKGELASKNSKYQAMQLFKKVWPAAFWFLRVSFGVALLASIAAIFSTIFFLQTSSSSSDRDDDRRERSGSFGGGSFGGGSSFNMWFGPSPFDFFYYRPYGYFGYYGPNARPPEQMGFLESVFSYIFGDGNPNAGLEERRLALAANMIRENGGAVTAEQLAPFCDDIPSPNDDDGSTYVDEGYVLPIVSALDGTPQVTEDGSIVYTFSDLLQSTSNTKLLSTPAQDSMILRRAGISENASAAEIKQILKYNGINTRGALERKDLIRLLSDVLPPMTETEKAELMAADPQVLQEREYKFSLAPDFNKVLAGGLGVVNLGGALYLGNLLGQYAAYGVRLPSYMGLVQAGYPLLFAYAVLFNVIPLVRNAYIKSENEKIRARNRLRRNWKTALQSALATSRVGRKIAAARKLGRSMKKLGSSRDIVYDTRSSMEDATKAKQELDMEDFDKKLRESSSDDDSSFQ